MQFGKIVNVYRYIVKFVYGLKTSIKKTRAPIQRGFISKYRRDWIICGQTIPRVQKYNKASGQIVLVINIAGTDR